jgi:leucyl-tRNA synthetase
MGKYNHQEIEKKWQKFWEQNKIFAAKTGSKKPKYYALDMFPYPSGAGLHVGHPEGYTATDIISRKKRHQGFEVLHPMGWDAFGLPAENYALKTGVHPAISTAENIKTFKRQIQSLGFSYDWEREFATTDENYFKWTQWIFLQLFKKGLAYEKEMPMNWCPQCRVVAANEEVEQGTHERCGTPVERKNLRQWMFAITKYADRLLNDLDTLPDWPEAIRTQQKNWIGKSEGAEVDFEINGKKVRVFTTRPDTLFGATYFVLSPEHPFVSHITTNEQRLAVEQYQKDCAAKSEMERTELNKEKSGVFTGAFATNPVNEKEIPVWIADYVMMSYGTGAIMAVPAHDERDFEFAKKYDLPIVRVVEDKSFRISFLDINEEVKKQIQKDFVDGVYVKEVMLGNGFYSVTSCSEQELKKILKKYSEESFEYFEDKTVDPKEWYSDEKKITVFSENGVSVNSDFLDGLATWEAKEEIIKKLGEEKKGEKKINFKLRDWIFTRQRFWGEPIPLVFDAEGNVYPLDDSELPLTLPEVDDYHPTADGQPPLARATEWVNVKGYFTKKGTVKTVKKGESVPAGVEVQDFKRETSTMPNWAGSSWYWLRYMDAINEQEFCSKEADAYWGNVDLYVGGTEHAVLHLLYSRFWHKVLYDLGLTHTIEPFKKLVNQGLILGADGEKMSKSRGNVINPDEIVFEFGADTLRMYEMFMGPFEQAKPWATEAVGGMRKFLEKIWRMCGDWKINEEKAPEEWKKEKQQEWEQSTSEIKKMLHKTIKKVGEDIDEFKFNTAISALMSFVNVCLRTKEENPEEFSSYSSSAIPVGVYLPQTAIKDFVKLLSPFAPHLAEEIWASVLGETKSIAYEPWPQYDPAYLVDDTVTYAVQVNGKLRGDFSISKDAGKEEVLEMARGIEKVQKYLSEGEVVKEIFVPGKIVGFVVK